MAYELPPQALEYIQAHEQELIQLLKTLCAIPSPSHQEHRRAQFCKQWLEEAGCEGVYIDEALNVIYPVNADKSNQLTLFTAHMDTVFPDLEPLPMEEKEGILYCPGAGDDTGNVALLLMIAKYVAQNHLKPENGFLMVCNSCEEALGNLKGIKQIMKDFAGRIGQVYVFDGLYNQVVNWPVAVIRYRVSVGAQGGHAYLNFGNTSAIACTSGIIHDIYQMKIPEGCKSSYNVGVWSGGEVPNGIAQKAWFQIEMRSELKENLDYLHNRFLEIVRAHEQSDGCEIQLEVIGRRPAKEGVDPQIQAGIEEKIRTILTQYCGKEPIFRSGSGDLNIPMSMGVPGVGFCGYKVTGVHTREEFVELDSFRTAFAVNLTVVLSCL